MIQDIEYNGTAVEGIILHPTLSARGYVFGIEEQDDKVWILINSNDWANAVAARYMEDVMDDVPREVFYTPILENEEIARKVIGGIYRWTSRVE
jgi:hypothetical protein